MKKLLSILGALSFTALASTTVVACSKEEAPKTPESLNGKTFDVALNTLVEPKLDDIWPTLPVKPEVHADDDKLEQYQWGDKALGFLYSTLWSINQKNAEYPIQNQEVAQYVTKGESLVRLAAEDGSNITVDGKTISEIVEETKIDDWHKIVLAEGQKVVFDFVVNSYKGAEVDHKTDVEITINLI